MAQGAHMLKVDDVEREAEDVAKKNFGAQNVVRVMVKPMVDLDGDDAWRVTIVIDPRIVDSVSGDSVLDNLIEIHNRLALKGEERLPFVEFATEEELAESDDPEP
jgi:hypothetical protein